MVTVGGRPILWHIMKNYAHFGHDKFHLALGYKADVIRQFFCEYFGSLQDVTVHTGSGEIIPHKKPEEDWTVHMVDTGEDTNTAGRILRLRSWLGEEPFLLSYGDGLANVDIGAVIDFHREHGRLVTLTAAQPEARFGALRLNGPNVDNFAEKPKGGEGWANAGFMVIEPGFFDYIKGDATGLEVLREVAEDGQVAAYRHPGYWQWMDTIRDREALEAEWNTGSPKWKMW